MLLARGRTVLDVPFGCGAARPLNMATSPTNSDQQPSASRLWVRLTQDGVQSSPVLLRLTDQMDCQCVYDLKEAVKEKFKEDLPGVSAAKLDVSHANGTVIEEDTLVADLEGGWNKSSALLVSAPAGEPNISSSCWCSNNTLS
jgi:hypothetical protein